MKSLPLVFDRFADALDEEIVAPGARSVHADCDLVGDQNAGESFAGELARIIRPRLTDVV
jgi:hypothetical protein